MVKARKYKVIFINLLCFTFEKFDLLMYEKLIDLSQVLKTRWHARDGLGARRKHNLTLTRLCWLTGLHHLRWGTSVALHRNLLPSGRPVGLSRGWGVALRWMGIWLSHVGLLLAWVGLGGISGLWVAWVALRWNISWRWCICWIF